ncbi:MAG: pyridoxal phosphate-dependent class II aminotransferase, partial [Pseudomonadota bacterium]|nr:pyridoxal phosphate-dependent class II aminotransferase [Pseudomonadota bacterium]
MNQHSGTVGNEAFERLFQHGGDINSARVAFPDAPAPWIDLSTGVNPVPYPLPTFAGEDWTRLPSPADVAALQTLAAARYGARRGDVVVAPGTQALIQWLPRLFPTAVVAIPGPTYSGHESAWRAAGAQVRGDTEAAHIVVVNPNNPDGRRWPPAQLRAFAARAAQSGGLLVVDEAFAEFDPETFARDVPAATVVLRSFGKAYGLAGLRLGFAIAQAPLAQALREALGAWAVSGPALTLGRQALADAAWLTRTRARLAADVAWLDARLI